MGGDFSTSLRRQTGSQWGKRILGGMALTTAAYLGVQGIRCYRAVHKAAAKLASYPVQVAHLNYGEMAYLNIPPATNCANTSAPIILSLHGLYGGYDQATENVKDFSKPYRIIAPSRFGYPGSSISKNGTPKEQAAALLELLDTLNIEKVYVLGASAGGTPAIRFALDYPERASGLILLSSAPVWDKKPQKLPGRMGPASVVNRNYLMWLLSPFFQLIFGLPSNTIYGMLPLRERQAGIDIDATITNPDMAVHYEHYPVETLKPPVLLLHAKDDRVVPFAPPQGQVQASLHRYPNLTTVLFDTGGHMIQGHPGKVRHAIAQFIRETS